MSEQFDPMRDFSMPFATPGMPILWYRRGTFDRTSVEVAYMIHAGSRTAVILSSTGRRLDAVRHISDPKLQLSEEQRENGAWDFTDEYKRAREIEERILARLDVLEERIGIQVLDAEPQDEKPADEKPREGASRNPPKVSPQMQEYRDLLRRAKDMGIDVPAGASKAEVLSWMEKKQPVAAD
jgi:hypothetical protein